MSNKRGEMVRALNALYAQVPEEVADGVKEYVTAHVDELNAHVLTLHAALKISSSLVTSREVQSLEDMRRCEQALLLTDDAVREAVNHVHRVTAEHIRAEDNAHWEEWDKAGKPMSDDFLEAMGLKKP